MPGADDLMLWACAALAQKERELIAERTRTAHRLVLEVERLQAEGVNGQAALARALNQRGVPVPSGWRTWTHTTVARVLARSGGPIMRHVPSPESPPATRP